MITPASDADTALSNPALVNLIHSSSPVHAFGNPSGDVTFSAITLTTNRRRGQVVDKGLLICSSNCHAQMQLAKVGRTGTRHSYPQETLQEQQSEPISLCCATKKPRTARTGIREIGSVYAEGLFKRVARAI